ncbi:MarR family winged helix-turn-helix transcriptional regulator [Pelomonas sp. KK5]|uniref:MarR family winged helix-turn-helix transcriptional regulator n=1 Tax=Pelomonas sp. KK5 TaxID=1855730 RepID=UPI00097C2D8E|nr:MarR family winged helix-turn-helix transcriptional regulator [Pelomonas sp. KK5]
MESIDVDDLHSLLGSISRARLVGRALFDRHVAVPLGLSRPEFNVLLLLLANEELMSAQLSQAMMMPKSNVSTLVARLKLRKLVESVESDLRRQWQPLVLTTQGRNLALQASALRGPMDDELGRLLSPEERATLIRLLGKIVDGALPTGPG